MMRRHRHVAPVEVERSLQPRSAFGVGSAGAVGVVVVVVVVSVAAGIVLVLDVAGELLVVPAVFVLVDVVVVWA